MLSEKILSSSTIGAGAAGSGSGSGTGAGIICAATSLISASSSGLAAISSSTSVAKSLPPSFLEATMRRLNWSGVTSA